MQPTRGRSLARRFRASAAFVRRRHGSCSSLLPMQLLGAATAAPRRSWRAVAARSWLGVSFCAGTQVEHTFWRVPRSKRRLRAAREASVHCLRYARTPLRLLW